MSSVNTNQSETKTREEDNVEDLFLQMMLTESKEKHDASQQVQQTLPPSGFDFRHLMVLRNIPLSSFYGVDIDNLSLPIQLPSSVGPFYGFDEESLAAENAALDEFYANLRREKAAGGKNQSSGSKCSQDQSRNFLLPRSTSEEDDDLFTLRLLLGYKLHHGSIPNILDQPTTFGLQLPHLLVYVNHETGRCISGSLLTDKLMKLQTKYKKLVAEKGKSPEHQDFSTPGDYIFFRLAELTWEQYLESDVPREVDVHCKDNWEASDW